MPLCTLHLVRLHSSNSKASPHPNRAQFLQRLLSSSPLGPRVLVASVVRRPVIVANRIDPVYLNSTKWDLLLIIGPEKGTSGTSGDAAAPPPPPMPFSLKEHAQTKADVEAEYLIDVGIPSRILESYAERTRALNEEAAKSNQRPSTQTLLNNPARAHPGYEPKTSQLLEISQDLVDLIDDLDQLGDVDGLASAVGPVHQLNLLSFKKSKEDKERYYKYGQSFAKVASQFGGEAKLLGSVVENSSRKELSKWDEVSLVSYHSLRHFAAMAASEDYQSINRNYRLPSLDDTTIICTQEVDLDRLRSKARARM